jgi:prepilin-type N-terminal cleavage/methylation domain-containing protein
VENKISAVRTLKRSQAGFTLLEIVVVLVLVAIVIGGAFGLMIASNDERALNRDSAEIEVLAKRARAISSLQQRPYALEFYEQTVTLMPCWILATGKTPRPRRKPGWLKRRNPARRQRPRVSPRSTQAGPSMKTFRCSSAAGPVMPGCR